MVDKPTIPYSKFQELDLVIAKVVKAEKKEGSDKLLRLTVQMGDMTKTILSGIAGWYSPESVVGKKIVVLKNLEPKKIMGEESQGMLLAATDADGKAILLIPETDVPDGTTVH